ncbi:hypothetical protein GCM10027060_26680 [Nesterenkonia halophila]
MAKKINTRRTAGQRQAEMTALHEQIASKVEELRDTDQWAVFLRWVQAFHDYSFSNQVLIWSQMPEATNVAGFQKWKQLGRQVTKGQKGIRIIGGRAFRVTEEDEETGEENTRRGVRFFPCSVFDISQTEPIEGAEQPEEIAQPLTGDDPLGIAEAVSDWLTAEGWTVEFRPVEGSANGYTTTDGSRQVVVDSDMEPAQQAKTALHEAAHAILHAEDPAAAERGTKETEAESVAYVVGGLLGVDTSSYSVGYVGGWSGADVDAIRATAENVSRAARMIHDGITEQAADREPVAA